MKLIAGVILSLSLLELFHCVPLIGSDDGGFKETNTTSSWNYGVGVGLNVGLEGRWKNGQGAVGTVNHLGFDVGGNKTNSQKDTNYAINPVPAPNNAGSGLGSPNYQTPGSLYYPAPGPVNYPAPGTPYYNQFASQPIQQWPAPQGSPQQYGPQEAQRYSRAQQYALTQQYPPAQQYASAQQYAPAQQYPPAQQYAAVQQYTPAQQYATAQQYAPVPLYVQPGSPQQVPQDAPGNGAPNENHNIQ